MFPLLDTLNDPSDLRRLEAPQLKTLAEELRAFLLESVSKTGGHLSSNLGTVELTIALHYVFDTPEDRLVWDVGHQTYPHKVLTGRRAGMSRLRMKDGISGFPRRCESPYDTFGVGHSSTSISAALGMAVAARNKGEDRRVVAIIGDGAMSAGQAFEALNNAGVEDANLLVILNDNDMSISPPVGALNKYLARLLSGRTFNAARRVGERVLKNMPSVLEFANRVEEHVKGMISPGTLFEELGFNYIGPIDGHDLDSLIPTLQNLRQLKGPQFLHVVTRKGQATSLPRTTRSSITASRSSTPATASPAARPAASLPTRRFSATGYAIWPRPIHGWWASRPQCAKARASSASPRSTRTATTTSALPNNMR